MNNRLDGNKYVTDLTGLRVDKLLITKFKYVKKLKETSVAVWECICDCGRKIDRRSSYLNRKASFKSCGCHTVTGKPKVGSKLLWGFGINDLLTPTQKEEKDSITGKRIVVWRCPYYQKWMSMIRRCYSEVAHQKHLSYRGCTVCEEWRYFSNFKSWMEGQEWKGKDLDKDLIDATNKVYCPSMCTFVSLSINEFMTSSKGSRGEYPLGVSLDKETNKFISQCRNPLTKCQDKLGRFSSPLEAHNAWKVKKLEWANYLGALEGNKIVAELLIKRYTFKEGEVCQY